jgi:DNA-binding transcriptional LysR family regulator
MSGYAPAVLLLPNFYPHFWLTMQAYTRKSELNWKSKCRRLDTTGLRAQIFRRDELVLVMPLTHDLACSKEPVSFIETLDEEWITLTAGAAMLQKQQQAALRANRPLKLRMQVRSFDAVCRLVASGLGIAILPKGACLPIIKAMKLAWRPIKDEWAERRLLVATASHESDTDTVCLVEILAKPSQNAKTKCHK